MNPSRSHEDRLLHLPEGGSLNALEFRPDVVVKSYDGSIPRGFEKLYKEYAFLKELPARVAQHFAKPVFYLDRLHPKRTELHLRREPDPAVAKAILLGLIRPSRTSAIVAESLRVLLEDLYPIRHRTLRGSAIYEQYHLPRLHTAVSDLREIPGIADLVTATEVRVNGTECPSIATAVQWLDEQPPPYARTARLVAAHGDAHLDNILATTDGPVRVTFVDPRGDPTLPPHYDFAKMLKAARTGYDLVHYGRYDLNVTTRGNTVSVDLALDDSSDQHYRAALEVLRQAVPHYAEAERVKLSEFLTAAIVAEAVHIISFAFYHAHHPRGRDTRRVVAYLATAARLVRDLMYRKPDAARTLEPLSL